MDSNQFFQLTPDHVLNAIEKKGIQTTGRIFQLNSYENRVYEIELEKEQNLVNENVNIIPNVPHKVVSKFYRPGRWTKEQILEEHSFLQELVDHEIPAIAPIKFNDGTTLSDVDGIYFTLFPKVGGRAPEDFQKDDLKQIGRLLARMHIVGSSKESVHRLKLNESTYAIEPLNLLLKGGFIPLEFQKTYESFVKVIVDKSKDILGSFQSIRVHGDCHKGNLLWNNGKAFFLDFDDFVNAPAVQDLWLLCPGRDEESKENLEQILESYSSLRTFNGKELRGIELLRGLRIIHFSGWIARRWDDPIFKNAFSQFRTIEYWRDELRCLEEIISLSN